MSTWSLSGKFATKKVGDYVEAVEALEKTARDVKGPELISILKNWCEALEELNPNSKQDTFTEDCESDWHDLGDRSNSGAAAADPKRICKDFSKLFKDDSTKTPIDFRMLFLRSHALEKVVAGCISYAGTSPEVWQALEQLLGICLDIEMKTSVSRLVKELQVMSKACGRHHGRIVTSTAEAVDLVTEAISALKIHPELENLEGRIGDLKVEVGMASSVSEPHERVADADVDSLMVKEGAKIAKRNWDRGCELWKLVGLRNASFREGLGRRSQYEDASRALDSQLKMISESHHAVQKKISQAENQYKVQAQKQDSQLAVHSRRVDSCRDEVNRLRAEKRRLEEMLAKVEKDLEVAEEHCAEMMEDKHVYEEGESLLLDGVLHQVEQLKEEGHRHSNEQAVLLAAKKVVGHLDESLATHFQQGGEYAHALEEASEDWWLSCGEKCCLALKDEIQMMLRQLRFCHSELASLEGKEDHISEIGMQSMIADVDRNRSRLQQKYLQAENATEELIDEANAVRKTIMNLSGQRRVELLSTPTSTSPTALRISSSGHLPMSSDQTLTKCSINGIMDQSMRCPTAPTPELAAVFAELFELESEYRFMNRPPGVPHGVHHPRDFSEGESSFESISPVGRMDGVAWESPCNG